MKRIISLVLILVIISVVLPGCQSSELTPLSDEMRFEIQEYYSRSEGNDEKNVAGKRYYGTYNGYVILMEPGQLLAVTEISIGNQVFKWGSYFTIDAYKNGKAQPLKDVYEAGEISDRDLSRIMKEHKAHFAEFHGWDYDKE